ncbi:PREDICTED: chondroitin proteoglycan 2-like [Habropoda laboriosa]|uniref:chondroitin proteoglycan 2-like n=1 Tax=Habropoda laboriosa TaxID=597456 RepID=UPI00083DCAC4|nr:PREDICTED: chondroitin proteoglycan 2-like [Habropoda laboriosa]
MTSTMIVHPLIACGLFLGLASCASQNRYILVGNHGDYATTKQASASCPERNGRFPNPTQCDAYVECIEGVPEDKLCPEGLVFNPDARFNYPCGYPIDVDCQGRPNRQPAQSTEICPHQYGYFKVGDHQNCGQFMNCADGRGHIFDCPEGLAFNAATYRCDWPDQVPDCDAEAFLGFRCPDELKNPNLRDGIHLYRSHLDCQRYYICVNGRPRLQNCGKGKAFNEDINTCDDAENVTNCEIPGLLGKKLTQLTEVSTHGVSQNKYGQ